MINNKKVLAVITARGGSKGLPGKNIKLLNGKPLIAWSIEQGLASEAVDKVLVSTDSNEIAEISRHFGADVPFQRPAELASDTATSMDVIIHALDYLKEKDDHYDVLILLEPTSPLRDSQDIDRALSMLTSDSKAKSIAGVCQVEGQHPEFLIQIEDGFMYPYGDFDVKRRQDISQLYFFEGSVYAAYTEYLREARTFYSKSTLAYVVPKWKSFEIDDAIDFSIVEHLLKQKENGFIL